MCCCAEFIIKYVLFFANFVFSLAGIALIGIGIAVLVQLSDVPDVITDNVSGIPIATIVLGTIIFAIAFFGCCGAIRESRCLLTMYFVCMAILAAGKIYLTTVIFNGLDNIESTVLRWVNEAFVPDSPNNHGFNLLEIAFQCCGTTGPSSYAPAPLPASCCPGGASASALATCAASDAFSSGCASKLSDYFATFGEATGAVLIVIIIVELVAMCFGIFMCWSVSSKRR